MSHALRVGVADQIGYFRAYNTDGSAKTDLTSSTPGLALSVFRVGAAAVSISSLSAKAADNTAHADGAIRAVSGNLYTVDFPDAACADQVPSISVKGSYTGGVIEGPEHPLIGYNPASVAVGALQPATAGRTLNVSASGAALSELDSSVRVKLDASQPDYAPATAAALATAYAVIQLTDTDVSAMEARLPSDPADQSAVEAAITAATSPLATSSALSTAAGNITTILGKFTGITLLARWLGALAGKTADTTTRTEINATTAGAGYNETTDSQEAIRDRGDAAWTSGGGGSSESALMVSTTIATLSSQTVFTLTAGSADNDVYNDQLVVVTDAATSTQKCRALVSDYVGSTKTLTLASTPGFEVAAGDSIAIIAVAGLTSAQNARLSLLGAGTRLTVTADSGASIKLKIGDDYSAANGSAKRIEINDIDGSIYNALRDESLTARAFGFGYVETGGVRSRDIITGTIARSTVTYTPAAGSVKAYTTVFVEMSVPSTIAPRWGKYDVKVTHSDGKKQTLFTGECETVADYKS